MRYTEEDKNTFKETYLKLGSTRLAILELGYPSTKTASVWVKDIKLEVLYLRENKYMTVKAISEAIRNSSLEEVSKDSNLSITYLKIILLADNKGYIPIIKDTCTHVSHTPAYTVEQKQRAIDVYRIVGSFKEVIEQLGYPSEMTLRNWVGVKPRNSVESYNKAKDMILEGRLPLMDISRKTQVDVRTLTRYTKELGIAPYSKYRKKQVIRVLKDVYINKTMTVEEAANKLGVSEKTVTTYRSYNRCALYNGV